PTHNASTIHIRERTLPQTQGFQRLYSSSHSPTTVKCLARILGFTMENQQFSATGLRKTSVARIRMTPGSGKIEINGKSFEDYFPTVPLQSAVLQPLQVVKLTNSYDLSINTTGGGAAGQAGAARLAISRALLLVDANLRGTL